MGIISNILNRTQTTSPDGGGIVSRVLGSVKQAGQQIESKIGSLLSPKKSMTFTVGEGLNDQQKATADATIRKQDDIGASQQLTFGEGLGIVSKAINTGVKKKLGHEVRPSDVVSKDLRNEAFSAFADPALGFTGGEDLVARKLGNAKVPKSALEYFAKTGDLEKTKQAVRAFNVPETSVDDLAGRLAKTKSVDEVKAVLMGTAETGARKEGIVSKVLKGAEEAPAAPGEAFVPKAEQPASTLKIRRYGNTGIEDVDVTPTGTGKIADVDVFTHPTYDGKLTGVTDRRTGLSVGESKYKNPARAIADVQQKLVEKAGSDDALKEKFAKAHALPTAHQINDVPEIPSQSTVAYHGTPDTSITSLKSSKNGDLGPGIYLARNKDVAKNFSQLGFRDSSFEAVGDGSYINLNTKEKITPPSPGVLDIDLKDLKIKKLDEGEFQAEIEKLRQSNGVLPANYEAMAQKKFIDEGYDGVELTSTPRGENDQVLIFPNAESKISIQTAADTNVGTKRSGGISFLRDGSIKNPIQLPEKIIGKKKGNETPKVSETKDVQTANSQGQKTAELRIQTQQNKIGTKQGKLGKLVSASKNSSSYKDTKSDQKTGLLDSQNQIDDPKVSSQSKDIGGIEREDLTQSLKETLNLEDLRKKAALPGKESQEKTKQHQSSQSSSGPSMSVDGGVSTYTDTISYQPQDVKEAEQFLQKFDFADLAPSKEPIFSSLLTSPDLLHDILGFTGQFRDFFRNVEHVFPKNKQDEVARLIIDPFDAAKSEYVDMQKDFATRLHEEIEVKLGIKKGTPESAAIMNYGERNLEGEFAPPEPMDEYKLVALFGREKANNIIKADAWFRKQYNDLIDEINAERKNIYGSVWKKKENLDEEIKLLEGKVANKQAELDAKKRTDTLTYTKLSQQKERLSDALQRRKDLLSSDLWWRGKVIPKRNDYYRHFRETAEGFKAIKNILIGDSKIAPSLSGISPDTKPKSKFLKFAQKRIGNNSERDAIGGFIDYLPAAGHAIYIDPQINRFRQLAKEMAEATVETKSANNFIEHLQDFANDLAGKSSGADRYIQKLAGRKTMSALQWVNSRIKANMIVGNLSSAVAQAFNIPQGIGAARQYSIGGLKRTLASNFVENAPMKESIFIKERFDSDVFSQFDRGLLNNTKKFAVWITGVLDEAGTKFIWNSMYQKAVAQKIENPVRYADNQTRKLVAGRGIGEQPLGQKSKTMQFIAPFQLEVGNLWWVMKDQVSEKDFGGLVIFMVTMFLMNQAAKEIRGNDVGFDPIEATIEGVAAFKQEDNKVKGAAKFLGRIGGEILSNMPGGQTLAGLYPKDGMKSLGGVTREGLFGSNDPTRFGSGLVLTKGFGDIPASLVLPFGGGQLKKTYEGTKAYVKGEVKNTQDKLITPVKKGLGTALKMGAFGKYAASDTTKSFKDQDELRARIDKQASERDQLSGNAEEKWAELKKLGEKDQDTAAAAFEKLSQENPELAKKVLDVYQSEQEGLSATDRLIKQLGVDNGERAKYIYEKVSALKTDAEKEAYYGDLIKKKLVTNQVSQQISYLVNPDSSPK